jgi:Nif-specific regulatory protein
VPENLLESELFGHVRGAFTGAVSDKKGKLELADNGTLFLDEIGELPLALQAKFLRVLQEREFERVGGTRSVQVNLRIVAATNLDLRAAAARGAFRPDLYFRLDVVSLRLPPLRERREDIPALAEHFAEKYMAEQDRALARISPEALQRLTGYDWPGNIRELQNAIERAVVLGASDVLEAANLPDNIRSGGPVAEDYRGAVRQFKRQLILKAVDRSRGSLAEAARMLGVHPNYLHRLVNNLDLRSELNGQVAEMALHIAAESQL